MKKEEISFSIITPVFNREDCIGRCIESVINQKYPFLEMWIIDDGSSDKTSGIVLDYIKKYDFIQFHKFEKNRGVNAARNYGIQKSKYKYILFLDSDDSFVEHALNNISSFIVEHPKYEQYLFAQDDRVDYYEKNEILSNNICELKFSDFLLERVTGDFTHVISTNLIKKYLFPEDLRIYENITFLEIYKESQKQLFSKITVVNRERNRNDSVSKDYRLKSKNVIKKKYIYEEKLLELFIADFRKYDHQGIFVEVMAKDVYSLGLAIGNYNLSFVENYLKHWNKNIPSVLKFIRILRLGYPLRLFIICYSNLKHYLVKV